MMLFLIEYDRVRGKLVTFREFADNDSNAAQAARLELELDRNRSGIESEIVLLEAPNEEALRRTHRRYFATLSELINLD